MIPICEQSTPPWVTNSGQETPTVNWVQNIRFNRVQFIKIGHVPRIDAEQGKDWDLGKVVKETGKNSSMYLELLLTETTAHSFLMETLGCMERQQHDLLCT